MQRFILVCGEPGSSEFVDRCSCAVACGYVPCGHACASAVPFSGGGDAENFDFSSGKPEKLLSQCFYDPDGKATMICAHCAKCETCGIAPNEDVYCGKFEDACYAEDENV